MWRIYSVCAGLSPAGSASFADAITVVYIVLYGYFDAYPIIFGQHGISGGKGGLMFVPVMIGFLILLGINFVHFERYKGLAEDAKRGIERRGIREGRVEPEERLVPRKFCRIAINLADEAVSHGLCRLFPCRNVLVCLDLWSPV